MLKNLLFVHGREAYRRNCYLIMYMFYKNIILVIPVWTYGWFSLMSGTDVYNNVYQNMYNLIFTAMPIIWYAVFDWEHQKEDLLKNPRYYTIGLNDVFFNINAFWRWFVYAVWQGILLVLIVLSTFNYAILDYGQTTGLTLQTTFIFYAVVIVVSVKVVISSFEFTFWMIFLMFLSILAWYLSYMLFSFAIMSSDQYGMM